MRSVIRFSCPMCGSKDYGSSQGDNDKLKRLCHGRVISYDPNELTHSCGFQWSEDDDWKYFIRVTRFDTKKEFDAVDAVGVKTLTNMTNEALVTKTRPPGWASEVSDKK